MNQPSIIIHRGPGGVPNDAAAATFRWDVRSPVPWGGLRSWTVQLRAVIGDHALDAALHPERSILSSALRGLGTHLTAPEQRARVIEGGLSAAELPIPFGRRRRQFDAWGALAAVALRGQEAVTIAVPEIGRLDLESLSAIRPILRAVPTGAVRFIIGHDPDIDLIDASPLDAWTRRQRVAILTALEALPATIVETHDVARPMPRPVGGLDPLDDGFETAAFERIARGVDDPNATFEAMQLAVDAYGYEAALRLALTLPATWNATPERTRAVRLAKSFTAHNLDALERDPWLVELKRATLTDLLAHESDGCARAHHAYRLGMVYARGRREFDAALPFFHEAIGNAVEAKADPRAPFYEAWALNGRAYARLRTGQVDEAATDCEAALARISAGRAGEVPKTDVMLLQAFLANNRFRLAADSGAPDREEWFARAHALADAIPVPDQPGVPWLPVGDDELDLAASRARYEVQLAEARAALDPELQAVSEHALGVVLYKLGDAHGALALFADALRIFRIMKADPDDLLTEELNCATAAYHDGDLEASRLWFEALRGNELLASTSAQAEVVGALAMVAGRGGGGDATLDDLCTTAVRLAEEGGECDALFRVLRSVAEARLLSGAPSAARQLLARARDLLRTMPDDDREAVAEDVFGALVSSLDAGERESSLLVAAIAHAPHALEDMNGWWDLPRLLPHLARAVAAGATFDLTAIEAFARERRDCARALRDISARLIRP